VPPMPSLHVFAVATALTRSIPENKIAKLSFLFREFGIAN
jgi:hypothetical protein